MIYAGRHRIHSPIRLSREPPDSWWRAANGGIRWRCHYLISNSICFLFVSIARLVKLWLGLQSQSLFPTLFAFARWAGRTAACAFALQHSATNWRERCRVLTRNLLLRCGKVRHRVLLSEFHFHICEGPG